MSYLSLKYPTTVSDILKKSLLVCPTVDLTASPSASQTLPSYTLRKKKKAPKSHSKILILVYRSFTSLHHSRSDAVHRSSSSCQYQEAFLPYSAVRIAEGCNIPI